MGVKTFADHPDKINRAGRPKGSVGKFTSLKDSFLKAFVAIENSNEPIAEWAKNNKKDFYSMVSKMLPAKLEADLNINKILVDRAEQDKTVIDETPKP